MHSGNSLGKKVEENGRSLFPLIPCHVSGGTEQKQPSLLSPLADLGVQFASLTFQRNGDGSAGEVWA